MVYLQLPKLKRERLIVLTGKEAVLISISSLIVAFIIFSGFLMLEGATPTEAYGHIFTFAFDPKLGLSTTLHRGFFILFSTLAFIVPMSAGLWNIGMEGQFYLGT
ncbi:MAG: hypothetical protein QXK19_03590, partial [Nitrososphaerota archaeon]